jgi:hypothetical protein
MMVRVFVALMLVVGIGNHVFAEQKDAAVKIGDLVVVTMKGDLAKEYLRSVSHETTARGVEVQVIAHIAQRLEDGRIRIECSMSGDKATRLVTLTATIDSSKVTTVIIPKGTEVYASPEAKPKLTTEESKDLRLELSDLKGVKLRTWTLSKEIGE